MRVLILRALKLGDFLTAIPAFRGIRRAFPDACIQLAAPREFAPLVDLLDDTIDELVHARGLDPLPGWVHGADIGIDVHGKGPASQLMLVAAGVRRLISFRNDAVPESAAGAVFDPDEHEVRRWCRMLGLAGIAADPSDLDLAIPSTRVPRRVRGATLIHPGAASESRRWPIERWIDVARAEKLAGRNVIVTGGPDEVALADAIAAGANLRDTDVFAGRTSLRELAALVAASGRIVCGDTGIAHLATAYRKPSVLLFGPTPPSTWGPPLRAQHRVLWHGSTGDPHGTTLDRGLAAIGVATVLDALASLPA